MIVTEKMNLNGRHFIRTHSDEGRYVVRDGIAYEEAIDPAEFGREYTEGDIIEGMSETEVKARAYEILAGEVM